MYSQDGSHGQAMDTGVQGLGEDPTRTVVSAITQEMRIIAMDGLGPFQDGSLSETLERQTS